MGARKNKKAFPELPPKRAKWRLCAVAAFLLVTLPAIGQESSSPELEDLDRLLRAGDPAFLAELDNFLAGTSSLTAVHEILNRYAERSATPPFKRELARRKARLFELEGDYEGARDTLALLDEDLLLQGPEPLAVDLARNHFELGELSSAEDWLEALTGHRVTRESLREITVLRCRLSLVQNHESSFGSCINTLELEEWNDMALALQFQWAAKESDREAMQRIAERLEAEYPFLWESLAGTEGRISRLPSPALILTDGTPLSAAAAGEERDSRATSPVAGQESNDASENGGDSQPAESNDRPEPSGVQVGSFRDRENAEYMARDVGNLGFTVSIRERERSGRLYHQVLVFPGEATAQNTVVRLKEHGFEGFLVFD